MCLLNTFTSHLPRCQLCDSLVCARVHVNALLCCACVRGVRAEMKCDVRVCTCEFRWCNNRAFFVGCVFEWQGERPRAG
jgi:hypothetical protein